MRKHYPLNSQGAEDAGQLPWKDGVPSTGTEGSYPGQALFTDTEAEVLSAIDAAGFVRNGSDLTQLIQAASRGIWLGQFGGGASALTGTVPNNLVIPSLQAGVRVRGIAASNYSGGGTLAITGVGTASGVMSCPITGSDGVAALPAGAWKAGQFLTFAIDASGNARFEGAIGFATGTPKITILTASGTFTPVGKTALVIATGGGGAGGSSNGTGTNTGNGGGAGSTAIALVSLAGVTSVPCTIGAGGAPSAANAAAESQAGSGGTTSFGGYAVAGGGQGGTNSTTTGPGYYTSTFGFGMGGAATAGTMLLAGGAGVPCIAGSSGDNFGGSGGASFWGGGAQGADAGNGSNTGVGRPGNSGGAYGSGGGGGDSGSYTAVQGGAGAPGVIFILELN